MGSFLVGKEQKSDNRPVELCFVSLNNITLVGSATFCSILKLFCDLIRRHTVLYFSPKKALLLPTNDKIKGLVGSQNGSNIHKSVPTSLCSPATNLYTSVVDFVKFRRLVESTLEGANPQRVSTEIIIEIKQFNPGRMASHASIESIWCTHRSIVFPSKMDF